MSEGKQRGDAEIDKLFGTEQERDAFYDASEKRKLKEGDIVSLDCGVVLDGFYGDAAITVAVGDKVGPEVQKLLEVTEASLNRAIEKMRIAGIKEMP